MTPGRALPTGVIGTEGRWVEGDRLGGADLARAWGLALRIREDPGAGRR